MVDGKHFYIYVVDGSMAVVIDGTVICIQITKAPQTNKSDDLLLNEHDFSLLLHFFRFFYFYLVFIFFSLSSVIDITLSCVYVCALQNDWR